MSFRELRDLCELMRSLGYKRRISVDSFRTSNFALVAEILYWLVQRYDPLANVSDCIETEQDRVDYLLSIAHIMASKARIILKTKNLYAADGRAVKELLKIARTLYKAQKECHDAKEEDDDDAEGAFALTGPLADLKATRAVATEITDRGAKLYDLLGQEPELRAVRTKALRFLDAVASNLDSRAEHAYMERTIRDSIANVAENVVGLEKQCKELKADETALQAKIKKKTAELERSEKRLKSLQSVRPAFMDEYESLEKQLAEQYELYLERFRNLDYLEHELDIYQRAEMSKVEASNRALKKMQQMWRDKEYEQMMGDNDLAAEESKRQYGQAPAARPGAAGGPQGRQPEMRGSMNAGSDDSSLSGSDSVDGSDSDAEVSLGSLTGSESGSDSGSGSGILDDDDDGSVSGSEGSEGFGSSDDDF